MATALVMPNSFDDLVDHNELSPTSTRPHSIDLTLELERQLDNESLPNSPAPNGRPQSLDTHVLASIVTQLRMSLEERTKERDALSNELAETKYREDNLKEALHTVTDKCLRTEAELTNAREQHKEDEEAISMLRQKVEESRRALMRLQTESRRASQVSNLTLDLSRPGASTNGLPSSKRASFIPLTGNPVGQMGHRRIASFSDPGLMSAPSFGQNSQWPSSPGATEFSPPARAAPPPMSGQSRRFSGMFGHAPPTLPDVPPFDPTEFETLRKELAVVKDQLEEAKHDASEAHEAREASEMCVRALRTFIAENSVGEQPSRSNARPGMKQPLPPVSAASPSSGSRWGFKLWSSDAPATPVNTPAAPPVSAASAGVPSPVARKLGGLFSPRSSISSTSTPTRPTEASAQQDLPYPGSDTSSLADSSTEPVSPASSMPRAGVLVRDAEGLSFESVNLPDADKGIAI